MHSYQHSESRYHIQIKSTYLKHSKNTYFFIQNYALLYDKIRHSLLLHAICFKILINNVN